MSDSVVRPSLACKAWPAEFGEEALATTTNEELDRLGALPVVRPLSIHDGTFMPNPLGHPSSLQSVVLFLSLMTSIYLTESRLSLTNISSFLRLQTPRSLSRTPTVPVYLPVSLI